MQVQITKILNFPEVMKSRTKRNWRLMAKIVSNSRNWSQIVENQSIPRKM